MVRLLHQHLPSINFFFYLTLCSLVLKKLPGKTVAPHVQKAQQLAEAGKVNARERKHVRALEAAVRGHLRLACRLWEEILVRFPTSDLDNQTYVMRPVTDLATGRVPAGCAGAQVRYRHVLLSGQSGGHSRRRSPRYGVLSCSLVLRVVLTAPRSVLALGGELWRPVRVRADAGPLFIRSRGVEPLQARRGGRPESRCAFHPVCLLHVVTFFFLLFCRVAGTQRK